MSVTITITVSDSGAAVVSPAGAAAPAEGAEATSGEGAPPPTLVGSPGAATSTAEDAVGPPPVELAQLELGETTLATGTGAPPAPAEFVEAAAESGDKPPEPMAVEELNKTTSRSSSTRKKSK